MYRSTYQGGGFDFFARPVPKVIKGLLLANIGIFLLQYLFAGNFLEAYFALHPVDAVEKFRVWQFLTYAYLHSLDSPFHIIFNLLFLWMFGVELCGYFGAKRFLIFYHFSAFLGAVAQVTANYVQNTPQSPTIGASGAIYGILVVYAILFPNRTILFFLIIPMRMKYFILILIGVDLISGTRFLSPTRAYFCHLGGALGGFLYYYFHGRIETFVGRIEEKLEAREAAREEDIRRTVDELLEKIRRDGIHKLTAKEKRFLNNASKLYKKEDDIS